MICRRGWGGMNLLMLNSMKRAPNLSENEVQYFYNLLYLLERETLYRGFNIQRIDSTIRKKVVLNSNFGKYESVLKPQDKNVLNYRGKSGKTEYLLKHIRNSFAHGLLESRNNDFYILDVPPGKITQHNLEKNASMIGLIEKDVFYKMIKELVNKNQNIRK